VGGIVSITNTTAVITGLTDGSNYTFTVKANNLAGESTGTVSNEVIPYTVPNAPTITATPGNGLVDLSWNEPNNNGRDISSYIIQTSTDLSNWLNSSTNASTRFIRISNLSNGIIYYFRVYARNLAGDGSSSNVVTEIPFTVPSAPIITATAGNGLIDLSWNEPNNNGRNISSYIIQTSTNLTYWIDSSTNVSQRFIRISDLSNGTLYYFRVYAINIAGNGLLSNNILAKPFTIPDSPINVLSDISGISAQANVRWTAPINNGGSIITGYTIISNPGGKLTTVTGSIRSAIVTGLINGTPYTFTVVATNIVGNSLPSNASNFVIPKTIPNVPIIKSVIAGNTQVTISWNPPTNNGGSIITGYTVTSNPGGKIISVSGSITTLKVTGLINGTTYTFKIFATNVIGNSLVSRPSNSVIPKTIPSAPVIKTVTAGNTKATITWTAPTNNGGSIITKYTVISNPKGKIAIVDGSTLIATIFELTNGIPFNFTVVATNDAGNSLPSGVSNSVIPVITIPSAPTIITTIADNTSASITWTIPDDGGSIITGYTVISNPENIKVNVNGSTTTTKVTGLTNGTPYTFTVIATNAVGNSPPSSSSISVIPKTIPNAPIIETATTSKSNVTVTWTAPTINGGSVITGYKIISNPGDITLSVDGLTTTATFYGLIIRKPYTFKVIAINEVGNSPPSSSSIPVIPYIVPSAPTGISSLISNNKNLNCYAQNINKTLKKEFYHSSLQVYSNEIYEINKKITEEGIPLKIWTDKINYLKKKYSVYKNKEKSNSYLTLLNLTNTITYKSNKNIYENLSNQLNEDLIIVNNNLNTKTQQLEECLGTDPNRRWFKIPDINLIKNLSIRQEYLIYIKKYGMPQNGIFIESILEFIRITLM